MSTAGFTYIVSVPSNLSNDENAKAVIERINTFIKGEKFEGEYSASFDNEDGDYTVSVVVPEDWKPADFAAVTAQITKVLTTFKPKTEESPKKTEEKTKDAETDSTDNNDSKADATESTEEDGFFVTQWNKFRGQSTAAQVGEAVLGVAIIVGSGYGVSMLFGSDEA